MQKRYIIMLFVLLLLGLGLGYASLQTNLNITGTTTLKDNRWDIHLENVQVKSGSVTATTPTINTTKDTVTYSVTLNKPGDFYEFTVDAKNDGSIDGMISNISSKLNGTEITTLPAALSYAVTYSDGIRIANNHILEASKLETFKIRVEYKKDLNAEDLPNEELTLSFTFQVTYIQANEEAIPVPHPKSFRNDSWETIITAIRNNNTDAYQVGDTKTIELGNDLGTQNIRIANMSTPTECSSESFSQTACGFVIEFEKIISLHRMTTTYTNVGGWPASEMRTYVNNDIYNSLPLELKTIIIDTTVISGHGSTSSETNFVSTDKLFLLSLHEVFENEANVQNGIDYNDTAYNNTRQMDYYLDSGVTTSSGFQKAKKQYNGTYTVLWLRTASRINNNNFRVVNNNGNWNTNISNIDMGVSPAFRIG